MLACEHVEERNPVGALEAEAESYHVVDFQVRNLQLRIRDMRLCKLGPISPSFPPMELQMLPYVVPSEPVPTKLTLHSSPVLVVAWKGSKASTVFRCSHTTLTLYRLCGALPCAASVIIAGNCKP